MKYEVAAAAMGSTTQCFKSLRQSIHAITSTDYSNCASSTFKNTHNGARTRQGCSSPIKRRHRFYSNQHDNHQKINNNDSHLLLRIHESVQQALFEQRPVVALESTIVAHGMPYPQNLELSIEVGRILREEYNVEPATIAVKDGYCHVGLTTDELHDLAVAKKDGGRVEKCSTRELSLILGRARAQNGLKSSSDNNGPYWGATTVASTMVLAHAAGIPVFVTGGIGGVHRHGEVTMDVSADLNELSRTPVIVVSAGIKSILDVRRTLEVLETNGVPAIAYQTDEFPAFFSPNSDVAAPARMDSPEEIAASYQAARMLNLPHGMLVAVPNRDPAGMHVENAIQKALALANERGIMGAAVTPFILQNVAVSTKGDSLRSNMSLVKNNARVGAEIAVAIAKQVRELGPRNDAYYDRVQSAGIPLPDATVIVVGGIVLDFVARPKHGTKLVLKTSNPATCWESDGGVGRNIAEVLGRLGTMPLLYSAVGADDRGRAIRSRLKSEYNIHTSDETVKVVESTNTATYLALLDEDGDLHTACADMDVLKHICMPSDAVLQKAKIVVMDANAPLETLQDCALRAKTAGVEVLLEPTSVHKAQILAQSSILMSSLTYATPNLDELLALSDGWNITETDHKMLLLDSNFVSIKEIAKHVLEKMNPDKACLLITLGAKGVLLAYTHNKYDNSIVFEHFDAPQDVDVGNATGAGDSFCGCFVHCIVNGMSILEAVKGGMQAAQLSLTCIDRAISPSLSNLKFDE